MNVLNAKYKNTKIAWDGITLPLLPGTPIGADGTIQNDADAVGIVTERFDAVPFLPELALLIAGDVEASQILYELSDEAKAALGGIRIFAADGSISGGETGGGKLYYHMIEAEGTTEEIFGGYVTVTIYLGIYSSSETEFTFETLKAALDQQYHFLAVPYGVLDDEVESYTSSPISVIRVNDDVLEGFMYDGGMGTNEWKSIEVFHDTLVSEDHDIEYTVTDTVSEV